MVNGILLKGQQKQLFHKQGSLTASCQHKASSKQASEVQESHNGRRMLLIRATTEVQQQHQVTMVCLLKHPGIPSLQKPLAQKTFSSSMLVIGIQICSGTWEATRVYYKPVSIDAVLWTNSQQSWLRKDFREPHSGSLSCVGLLPTSTFLISLWQLITQQTFLNTSYLSMVRWTNSGFLLVWKSRTQL